MFYEEHVLQDDFLMGGHVLHKNIFHGRLSYWRICITAEDVLWDDVLQEDMSYWKHTLREDMSYRGMFSG